MSDTQFFFNQEITSFDGTVFEFFHRIAEGAGGFFTPFAKIISLLGSKGIVFFLLSIVFMLFAKTRKGGVCMFGALVIGALIAGVILKNAVARVRPYDASETLRGYWEYVGGAESDSFCFPSGHTTMITAAAVAFFMFFDKKWSWTGFLGVLLMGFSRIYLIAHYFSDVVGGVAVGAFSAVVAYFITVLIWKLLEKNKEKKFFAFCLDFDVKTVFHKKSGDTVAVENVAENPAESVAESDVQKDEKKDSDE